MNYSILRDAAMDHGISIQRLCNKLAISREALADKLNGREQFTPAEIRKIKRLLHLTEEQTEEAFRKDPEEPEQETGK